MTARTLRSSVLFLLLSGCALAATLAASGQSAREKTIFVGVVDESGKPVKDVQQGEILIREDGVDREVVSIKPATEPLYIALLADTTPGAEDFIRDIRDGFSAFVKQVGTTAPDAQMLLMEFGQAAVVITPFTNDLETLDKSINRLFPKPKAGSVLLEALIASSNELAKRQSRRRAIVSFNMEPSNEQSREEPRKINEALRRSGAQLWSVSLQKGANKNSQRDVVLGQLVKNTGGRREFIVAQSAIGTYLKMYADALTSQYEVSYLRPGSGTPTVLQTGTTRTGARLHSSLFPPQ